MLKLQQRKQRGQADAASAVSNGTSTALKFLETLKTQNASPDLSNDLSRKPSHSRVEAEEHAMMLDRIHTENKHLLALLQDFKDLKLNLLAKAVELEEARAMIEHKKSASPLDELDRFVVTQNQRMRDSQLLTESDRAKSVQFSEEIASILSRFRSSQQELCQFVTAQLQTAYSHVHSKQLSQAFDALGRLYSLVSAQPGNVQSALPLADQL
eukprot:gene36758-44590_t